MTLIMLHFPEDIDVKIDGPAKLDMKRKDNPDGSTNISYLPMTPGAYYINIKYKGTPIKGSPFSAKVSGELFYFHLIRLLLVVVPVSYILTDIATDDGADFNLRSKMHCVFSALGKVVAHAASFSIFLLLRLRWYQHHPW